MSKEAVIEETLKDILKTLKSMNKKLDKLDGLDYKMDMLETVVEETRNFEIFANEGGIGPQIEQSYSTENSMDSADLDELSDEVYRYEDY